VVLEPRTGRWQGLAVLDARRASLWEHAIVRGTSGVSRDGWVLTSGVTFHRSPVRFSACAFRDHRGLDDQLNVFRSRVELVGCELGDCSGDAFDGDFVEGLVDRCSFHDVGGDAIDFSGTRNLIVRDSALLRIADKGVSAGEDSHVRVERLFAEDVSIAVAAKDRSVVRVEEATIRRARFGMAAYQKKPEYGPGAIEARSVRFEDVASKTIIQTRSVVVLDGRRIKGTKLDVKRLYEAGILGN
jgi:hypothetical protein